MSVACSPSGRCGRPCLGAAVAVLGVAAIAAAGFVGWSDPLSAGPSAGAPAVSPSAVGKRTETVLSSQVPWRTDLTAALAESARSGEPVLVDFAAAWCPPCQLLEEKTWPAPAVRAVFADGVIPVNLDLDDAAAQAASETYDVAYLPTLLLLDSEGEEVARTGYIDAAGLVEFFDEHKAAATAPGR
ncbi:thioredoxin family protein [Alienimonas sp. DA493]|uniref:thioredoxin family protein n=1 Tax=Alienimonas sp. DA493 TaxID=3373605 RepID=UPI003754415C